MLATALVTRLPIASLSLAMLMHVRALTGSFEAAGLTVGVDLAASALVAPVLGRIIDRRGPRWLMTAGSLLWVVLVLAWSQVGSVLAWYLIWAGMGLAMSATSPASSGSPGAGYCTS